jgi:8-oxo-dGTP pyrophosphatase MutT (NUDIX family)
VTFHPQAAKEFGKLDGQSKRQVQRTIDALAVGEPTQTHWLDKPLQGWQGTKASRGHRIVHRTTDEGGLHIGYVGLHDYEKAERRLAVREPFEFEYARNTVPAPDMGAAYGQDIEPHGRYMTVREPKGNYVDSDRMKWEFGQHRFENPLHLDAEGWKQGLSEAHGGKTGRELSQAVRDAGHDGIVTHVTHRGRSFPDEIVDLTGFKRRSKMARQAAAEDYDPNDTSYRMQHRPPSAEDGIPMHDMTNKGGDISVPEDVYTHPHYYSDMSDPTNQEAHYHLRRVRGKPEAKVQVYRAMPAEYAHHGFRPGDWVSLSKDYARQHGMQENPHDDWPVIKTSVPAKHLHTDADDFREFGYNGPHHPSSQPVYKGGKNQKVHQHEDGIVRKVKPRTPKQAVYEGWEPHQRAVSEAQEAVRAEHPYLTAPLPDSMGERDEELRKVLRHGGHPRADDAYVHIHRDPNRSSSNSGISRETGAPIVSLHPSRADRGTITHEAAHILNDHEHGRQINEPSPDHYVHGIGFAQHYARLLQPYGPRTSPGGNYRPGAGDLFLNTYYGSLARQNRSLGHTAARPMPTNRIFGPTYGLDHRLFEGDKLKGEVIRDVMERLDRVLRVDSGLVDSDWMGYIEVYLAGSEASEWTSPSLEGNDDFDTLLGIHYAEFRGHDGRGASAQWIDKTDGEIDDVFNDVLRRLYNDEDWLAPFGGVWHLTGYVNEDAYDIRKIKPYAAYDLNKDAWAVKPPHLPSWGPESFPEGPALWHEAEAVADYADSILELPEPYRTQQGAALYEHLHADRRRAFGPNGEGWYDPGNVLEKYLDQLGLWAKLLHLKKNADGGTHDPGEQPMLEALAVMRQEGPLNIVRGIQVNHPDQFHPEAAARILKGQARPEDLLHGPINTDHVGAWWYHPQDGDVDDAKEHAVDSDETLHKNFHDGEYGRDEHGRVYGDVSVVMEATHPGGWDPENNTPHIVGMGASHLPDHSHMKLHTVHYSPDWGDTWHKMHLNPPVDIHTDGPAGPAPRTANSDGDRYVTCDQGHEHWGSNGAAGLLIKHRGDDGNMRYLLQKRSPWVDHGNTWSIPGGAIGSHESPEDAAYRESEEELGALPKLTHSHTTTDDHGGWAYHTVVAESPERFSPAGGGEDDDEHEGHGWFTHGEMSGLPLHPGFRKSWDRVRTSHPGNVRTTYLRTAAGEHWIAREHAYREPDELDEEIGTRNEFFDQVWRQLRPEQRENVHKNLHEMSRKKMFIGTNHAEKILDNGHMKTLHEQDPTEGGRSEDYLGNRKTLEHHVFGVPESTSDEHQPIYGSLHDDPSDNVYGQHHLELKPHVRARASMTLGDSLNRNLRGYHIEHVPHVSHGELRAMTDPTELINLAENEKPKTYGEFQVHGGIGVHDIAKLHVHEDHDSPLNDEDHRIMDKARAAGIEVVHHKPDPNHGLTDEQVAGLRGLR